MILASLNLSDETWTVSESDGSTSVAVGFTSESPTTTFDNLSFGWILTVDSVEEQSAAYPPEGVVYVSTDQQYMTVDAIDVRPDDVCVLTVWAENAGKRSETTHEWTVARPASPYPSWIWNVETGAWEAPVPMPTDGKRYVWDEDTTSWVESEPLI